MAILNVRWNPNDVNGSPTTSNNDLTVSLPSTTIIRATHEKTTGKWYWEVTLDNGGTQVNIGIAKKDSVITDSTFMPTSVRAYYGSNGYRNPENTSYGSKWVVGDTIGVALDMDNSKLEFYKNGVSMGVSHTDVKSLGEVKPFLRSAGSNIVVTANFGATPFKYAIPTGYFAYNNEVINKILLLSSGEKVKCINYSNGKNEVPTMTSDTLPSGEVLASNTNSTIGTFRAFDGNITTYWQTNNNITTNSWLRYKFSEPKIIKEYTITNSVITLAPKDFKLQASNDGVNFIDLDERVSITDWVVDTKKKYSIVNQTPYLYYRLFIVSNNGGSSIRINELELLSVDEGIVTELSSQSEQTFINHGMSQSDLASIDLSADFTEKHYIQDVSTVLGSGRVFEQALDVNKVLKKVTI